MSCHDECAVCAGLQAFRNIDTNADLPGAPLTLPHSELYRCGPCRHEETTAAVSVDTHPGRISSSVPQLQLQRGCICQHCRDRRRLAVLRSCICVQDTSGAPRHCCAALARETFSKSAGEQGEVGGLFMHATPARRLLMAWRKTHCIFKESRRHELDTASMPALMLSVQSALACKHAGFLACSCPWAISLASVCRLSS